MKLELGFIQINDIQFSKECKGFFYGKRLFYKFMGSSTSKTVNSPSRRLRTRPL